MRRPSVQWYTSKYEARRYEEFDAEQLLIWLRSLVSDSYILESIESELKAGLRIELFSLSSAQDSSTIMSSEEKTGDQVGRTWALFTPSLQLLSTALAGDDEAIEDLVIAAYSWLLARGYRAYKLITCDGEEISKNHFYTVPDQCNVDQLNSILKESLLRGSESKSTKSPQRIITLAPSNLEIVVALNAECSIIACEDSSDLPQSMIAVERLGPDLNPDLNRVIALDADLVISSLSVPGMERVVTYLSTQNISQLVLAPRSLSDVQRDIMRVAIALDLSSRGKAIVTALDQQRAALIATRPKQKVPVYLEWWPKPMFTPGESCFSNELIELAGGENVFGDRQGSSIEISPEELVDAEPKLCFLSWCGVPLEKLNPNQLRDRKGLDRLNSSARHHVIPIDEAFTGRPGPNMLEASRLMSLAIHEYLKSLGSERADQMSSSLSNRTK